MTKRGRRYSIPTRFAGLFAAGAIAILLAPGQPASAAPAADKTGPTFTLQPFAHFTYPATVQSPTAGGVTPFSQTGLYVSQAVQKWSASDPSGICEYQLYFDQGRMAPELVYQGLKTSYTFTMGDAGNPGYNWSGFDLRVKDCAGNWSSNDPSAFGGHDRYINSQSGRNSAATHDNTAAKYTGSWGTAKCTCFVGGTTSYSSIKGASATFTYTGNVLGWVSETGPTRGSAQIYQDGALKATISTYSATNTGAKLMWSNWFATAGKHTIRIVVAGTAGHPRVDIDSFFVGPDPAAE